jgi:hypothetical protein
MPSPKDTKGPIVKTGPTKGENRSRNNDGQWRKKREDAGKSKEKKKSSGCFISTAACHFRGLPDDCYELQLLRSFRDEYLIKTPEGESLVARYYLEAPEIAARLTQPEDLKYAWSSIATCVRLIEVRDYEETIKQYLEMFQNLKTRVQNASA